MSDREDDPADLFDAICRLDDIAEWLSSEGWPDEAARLRGLSSDLKGYVELRVVGPKRDA